MDGEMAQEMDQAVKNRTKARFRMGGGKLFGAETAHDLTKSRHCLVQVRQHRLFGRRLRFSKFALSVANVSSPTQLGAHKMVQIAGQMQDQMANRIARL